MNLEYEALDKFLQQSAEATEYAVVKALAGGFDGIDIRTTTGFPPGQSYVPWYEDHKPPINVPAAVTRYSFDGVTYQDIREHHK